MNTKVIRVGGASGFWGDSSISTSQLLQANVDYLVYDYLAEITMSILARARAKNSTQGYATDFVETTLKLNLPLIQKKKVKIISNAGGVNPVACAEAIEQILHTMQLDIKVAVVLGDDLLSHKEELANSEYREMFSQERFPDIHRIASINAYLGAFPIAKALDLGADIVITGRCVDSALTLGACIHEFGWKHQEWNKLAQGSLAGHLLECGAQATGGNFSDWEQIVDSLPNIGYPIAEIDADGKFICTKPEHTGGIVNIGTISEQLVYEIGDPQNYLLPDVTCDFSEVELIQEGTNRVSVSKAKGRSPSNCYKVSSTFSDGYRTGSTFTMYGKQAEKKAKHFAENVFTRTRMILQHMQLEDFRETCVEIIGSEVHYGVHKRLPDPREVDVKIAAIHPSQMGIGILLKEMVGMALSSPPGLSSFAGARPKPSPVVRLFSFLLSKDQVKIMIAIHGEEHFFQDKMFSEDQVSNMIHPMPKVTEKHELQAVPLSELAWARSGDKGNQANVGIIARKPQYLPYIIETLTTEFVSHLFAHFFPEDSAKGKVERFVLPGIHAVNFLIHNVLGGGGVASLRNDPQGKGYSQILLDTSIDIPVTWNKTK